MISGFPLAPGVLTVSVRNLLSFDNPIGKMIGFCFRGVILLRRTFFIFTLFFCMGSGAMAETLPRKILALWHSRDGKLGRDYSMSLLHRKLEFVFNHYGFNLIYHDLHEGPPPELGADYQGAVSWFNSEENNAPEAYADWLKRQIGRKKKILILGDFGFARKPSETEEKISRLNSVLTLLGMDATGNFYDNPLLHKIESMPDPKLAEFERELKHEIPPFRVVRNKDPKNEVWLRVSSGKEETFSDVIIVGSKGGYVQSGFTLFSHPQEGSTSWRVNPFALIKKIFLPENWPIPDTTTLYGERLFFSHIDGDGLMNLSLVDRKRFSSEVIRDEILKRYPLPVTVSVITIETDPQWEIEGARKFRDIARGIFKLPNVSPASHTFSHPLSWEKSPSTQEIKSYLGDKSNHEGPILSYYEAGKKLDYERETVSSLDYINENLLEGKKTELLLWSGSCRPPAEALEGLERRGYVNMNGGDSRMDSSFPSVGHLSSLYRRPGGRLQVYAAAPNENIYTNLWNPPYAGFEQVIETFENTDLDARLKPVNIYYHFYSGEHEASLKSLRKVYDWAMGKELHPIRAALYPRIVQGFLTANIESTGERSFLIKNTGALKTLRFEGMGLFPDYERSKNIVGHRIHHGRLYVHLGPEGESLLALTNKAPEGIFLHSSNAQLVNVSESSGRRRYEFRGEVPVKANFSVNGVKKKFTTPGKWGVVELEVK